MSARRYRHGSTRSLETPAFLTYEFYRKTLSLEESPEPYAEVDPVLGRIEIERLLARLPDEQREVIVLFYMQERSIEEDVDLPEGTVKSHLHRARKAMAAMLEVRR